MKVWHVLLIAVIAVCFVACSNQQGGTETKAEATATTTGEIQKVGDEISLAVVTPINTILEKPEEYLGKTLVIEGKVNGRCAGSGCWVSLAREGTDDVFYVKSDDHSFVFPEKSVGCNIKVQGDLMVMDPSGKEKKHEHKEGEVEEGHVCPQPVYYLNPKGCEVFPAVEGETTEKAEKDHA